LVRATAAELLGALGASRAQWTGCGHGVFERQRIGVSAIQKAGAYRIPRAGTASAQVTLATVTRKLISILSFP